METKQKAVVIFSGGQDSVTCLYWAISRGWDVYPITFDYGQKHRIEIASAIKIVEMAGLKDKHEIIKIDRDILAGTSPLTNSSVELEQYESVEHLPGGLEKTFVPMRNQLFITIAANRAYVIGARILVIGVSSVDSGGYPDCRPGFIREMQDVCNTGSFTGRDGAVGNLRILAPLQLLSKAETVRFAQDLPGCMEALAFSHTSYDGKYPPTGKDHASLLRAKGFEEAGVADPLVLRAHFIDGLMPLPSTANYDNYRPLKFNRADVVALSTTSEQSRTKH